MAPKAGGEGVDQMSADAAVTTGTKLINEQVPDADGAPRDIMVTVRLISRSVFLGLLTREPMIVEGLLQTLAGCPRPACEIATELTDRSTLNRALRSFEDRRLITVEGSHITLRKPESLRSYTS